MATSSFSLQMASCCVPATIRGSSHLVISAESEKPRQEEHYCDIISLTFDIPIHQFYYIKLFYDIIIVSVDTFSVNEMLHI